MAADGALVEILGEGVLGEAGLEHRNRRIKLACALERHTALEVDDSSAKVLGDEYSATRTCA